jgi:hypothetical protein
MPPSYRLEAFWGMDLGCFIAVSMLATTIFLCSLRLIKSAILNVPIQLFTKGALILAYNNFCIRLRALVEFLSNEREDFEGTLETYLFRLSKVLSCDERLEILTKVYGQMSVEQGFDSLLDNEAFLASLMAHARNRNVKIQDVILQLGEIHSKIVEDLAREAVQDRSVILDHAMNTVNPVQMLIVGAALTCYVSLGYDIITYIPREHWHNWYLIHWAIWHSRYRFIHLLPPGVFLFLYLTSEGSQIETIAEEEDIPG